MYMRTDLQMCGKLNVQSKKRCMVSGSLFSKSFFDTSNLVRILRLLKGDEGHNFRELGGPLREQEDSKGAEKASEKVRKAFQGKRA